MVNRVRRWLIVAGLLVQLGCHSTAVPEKETRTRYESDEQLNAARLIAAGTLRLGRITAVAEKIADAQPFGEIVTVSVQNMTGEPQTFRIDCGTVLRATDAHYQDLVVTRSAEVNLSAGASWSGKLEAFSLQLRRHYPYQPAEYQLGNLAEGELRRFVECFCFQHPTDARADLTPVQYAIWRIVDNITLSQLLVYMRGRGNPNIDELAAAERQARAQGRYTEQLLAGCQITAKFLD